MNPKLARTQHLTRHRHKSKFQEHESDEIQLDKMRHHQITKFENLIQLKIVIVNIGKKRFMQRIALFNIYAWCLYTDSIIGWSSMKLQYKSQDNVIYIEYSITVKYSCIASGIYTTLEFHFMGGVGTHNIKW